MRRAKPTERRLSSSCHPTPLRTSSPTWRGPSLGSRHGGRLRIDGRRRIAARRDQTRGIDSSLRRRRVSSSSWTAVPHCGSVVILIIVVALRRVDTQRCGHARAQRPRRRRCKHVKERNHKAQTTSAKWHRTFGDASPGTSASTVMSVLYRFISYFYFYKLVL